MKRIGRMTRGIVCGMALLGLAALALTAGGCARLPGAAPEFTATSTAAINPDMPPPEARPEANSRAETRARDQIMIQAGQLRLADGRTLEDLAAADPVVRAELFDTVRAAHVKDQSITTEGLITVTLNLDKAAVQRIIDGYQRRGGK